MGINNKGDVVGANSSPGGEEGFVYSDGKYTTISDPLGIVSGEPISVAPGINNKGDIVGYYEDSSGVHGFLDHLGNFYDNR